MNKILFENQQLCGKLIMSLIGFLFLASTVQAASGGLGAMAGQSVLSLYGI